MDKETNSSCFEMLDRDGLVQRVAKQLSAGIIAGRLAPGARLSESVVARQMGVSRAPVREAARLLESSGLITYEPNRGFFVRKVSVAALDDLYELRIVIEAAAVRRLLRNWSEAADKALSDQIRELYRVSEEKSSILTQVAADMQFHRLLCSGSGNPKFLTVFEQIAMETEFSIVVVGQLYDDAHRMAETHEPILEALRAGDEEKAVKAIRFHIAVAQRVVTGQFRKLAEGKAPK